MHPDIKLMPRLMVRFLMFFVFPLFCRDVVDLRFECGEGGIIRDCITVDNGIFVLIFGGHTVVVVHLSSY